MKMRKKEPHLTSSLSQAHEQGRYGKASRSTTPVHSRTFPIIAAAASTQKSENFIFSAQH
jgi:hypothetical protein